MAYGDCKDVTRKRAFDKIWRDKAFNIAKNWEYDGYQGGIASMVYRFWIKMLLVKQLKIKLGLMKN